MCLLRLICSVIWNFAGGKYMKKNKKTLVLALASILSAGALLGVVTSTQTGGVANIFAADNEDSYIWNHYKAVAPTIDSHGSKEFWANCTVLGQVRFEKPTKGKIQKENLDFKATPWFDELTPDDARYVAPLPSRTVATLSSENVTIIKDEGSSFMTFSNAMDELALKSGAINYGDKAKIIEEFGGSSRENDGIFIKTNKKELGNTMADASITLPAINFLEELKNGGVISMELGCRTGQGYIKFNGTKLFSNSTASVSQLTKAKAYFYLDNGGVKVSFIILEKDSADTTYSKYLRKEVTSSLNTEEANGTKSIVYNFGTNQYSRHYWLSNPTLVSKKEFKTPARATRPADDLYESYSLAGWYSETGKYDFSKPITAEERFTPKWIPGKQAPSYLDIGWAKANFGMGLTDKGDPQAANADIYNVAGVLSGLTWGIKDDAEKVKAYKAEFNKICQPQGISDDAGVFMRANGKGSYIDLPKINFLEKIPVGKKLFMKLGTNANNSYLNLNVKTDETRRIVETTNQQSGNEFFTKVLVSFYKDNDGKVRMTCDDTTIDLFNANGGGKIWETILTDSQANGTESLRLEHDQGGARYYWIGKPFTYNDDNVVLDVTKTSDQLTATGGVFQTKAVANATGNAPFNQWYNNSIIAAETDGIGIYGNDSNNAISLEFKANYKALLDKSQGVKFTIGVWNGTDTIYFNESAGYTSLGGSYNKPIIDKDHQYFDTNKYTREIIEKTWHNWQATVDRFDGFTVYNQNTAEKYQFTLTEGQLNGTEPLSFKLTASNANGHFFYLSNLTTFYC